MCLVGKDRLARRDLLVEHAAVSGAHELRGEPVGPPLVVADDVASRHAGVGLRGVAAGASMTGESGDRARSTFRSSGETPRA